MGGEAGAVRGREGRKADQQAGSGVPVRAVRSVGEEESGGNAHARVGRHVTRKERKGVWGGCDDEMTRHPKRK